VILGIHIGSSLIPLAESSQLLPAREQMAFTLGFHIILSCLGVAFPAMMLIANYIGLKKNDEVALTLAQRWSKVSAVLFAVGAVTGTVLTFEFGLLWPEFMSVYGDAFGVGFAVEGIFFFLEAIFIAIYILGWKRLSGWAHFWSGIPIFICGIGGAFSVVAMNSWMNQPQGYVMNAAGEITKVEPFKVIFNGATSYEVPHMILAAYMVTGFVVASVYAVGMLKGRRDRYHRLGMLLPLTVALALAPVQFFVGDTAARAVAKDQPIKFAAMECVYKTGAHQPEYLGGVCVDGEVKGAIKIPGLDSFLVGFSADTNVVGLDSVPKSDQPQNLTMLHLAFDLMVGIGSAYLLLGLWLAFSWWKQRDFPQTKWFLRIVAISGLGAIAALEAGWIVTEVGRQPWIVYEEMRVENAVTGASGVWVTFGIVFIVYAVLGTATILTLRTMAKRWRESGDEELAGLPYGAPEPPPEEEEASDEHS
jgi:cytochrome d ubiquinol oxidase subunit I